MKSIGNPLKIWASIGNCTFCSLICKKKHYFLTHIITHQPILKQDERQYSSSENEILKFDSNLTHPATMQFMIDIIGLLNVRKNANHNWYVKQLNMTSWKLISWGTISSPISARHHRDGFWIEFGGYTFHSFLCSVLLDSNRGWMI